MCIYLLNFSKSYFKFLNFKKIERLIQAHLGSIQINDFSLNQDIFRIFRVAQRISRCIVEYLCKCENQVKKPDGMYRVVKNYETFINSVMIYKSIFARIWYDSPHLFIQFSRIGPALSQALVNANITSINKLLNTNPRQMEVILKKSKPYGDTVIATLRNLPEFSISFNKLNNDQNNDKCCVDVICSMDNHNYLDDDGGQLGLAHPLMFILGDEKHNLLHFAKLKYHVNFIMILISYSKTFF